MDARKAKYKCGEHVHNSELKALEKVVQVRYPESYLWLDIYCSSVTAVAYDSENTDFIRAAGWYKAFGYIIVDELLMANGHGLRHIRHEYSRRD